ncbi:unnamed protein product [Cunninghamella echinulata]
MKFGLAFLIALCMVYINVVQSQKVCWKICHPKELSCPEGWAPEIFGDCHTCCRII